MTGYGRTEGQFEALRFTLELRSVNSRFVDMQIFVPRDLPHIEEWIRESMQKKVIRGKITCVFSVKQGEAFTSNGYEINEHLLKEFLTTAKRLKEDFQLDGNVNLYQILNRQELVCLGQNGQNEQQFRQIVEDALQQAFLEMESMQLKEGQFLKSLLENQRDLLRKRLGEVMALAKENSQKHFEGLMQRLGILLGKTELDPQQFQQEAAMLADRLDVSEEMGRLESHLSQFDMYLDSHENQVGKRLSFLLQEMLREVNTIGTKSNNAAISQRTVEMKNDLEILREQVQNIQ